MKASDLFVRCLEAEGTQFVLNRHEQGAAFMAEVYDLLTGNRAGCLGTPGPGAANLMGGRGPTAFCHLANDRRSTS